MQVKNQVQRLNAARSKAQQVVAEGSRLEGVLASAKKRKEELEVQCQEKFSCPVSGLGELISEFENVATKELASAESILGISDSEDNDSVEEDEDMDGLI